jgi:hypothetical protein
MLMRTGSVIAGLVSIAWGLYSVLAYQVVVTTMAVSNSSNAYANGTFVLIQMIQAVIIGIFALVLAVLGR